MGDKESKAGSISLSLNLHPQITLAFFFPCILSQLQLRSANWIIPTSPIELAEKEEVYD